MTTIFDKPLDSEVASNTQAIANMNISAISSSTTIASLCSSCPAGQHRYYFIADSNTLTDYPSTTRLYRVLLSIHKIDGTNNRADIEILGKTGSDVPWQFFGVYENGTMYWSLLGTKEVNVLKANCNYTYGDVNFRRYGNVVQVLISGLVNLPNGNNTICAVPSGYAPSSGGYGVDTIGFSANDALSNPRLLRVRLDASTGLSIYNYGQQLTNNNLNINVVYIVA